MRQCVTLMMWGEAEGGGAEGRVIPAVLVRGCKTM